MLLSRQQYFIITNKYANIRSIQKKIIEHKTELYVTEKNIITLQNKIRIYIIDNNETNIIYNNTYHDSNSTVINYNNMWTNIETKQNI